MQFHLAENLFHRVADKRNENSLEAPRFEITART